MNSGLVLNIYLKVYEEGGKGATQTPTHLHYWKKKNSFIPLRRARLTQKIPIFTILWLLKGVNDSQYRHHMK